MEGDFALYWDRKETGSPDAYLQLKTATGDVLGVVRIEDALPTDCRQCATDPHKVGDILKLLYHWLAPPSFIDQLKQQAQGTTQSNPAQVELPLPDLEHFGLVSSGEIKAENVCQLVSLVGDFRDRLPIYGALHELISRGYDLGEAAGFVYAEPDFFFDAKRSHLDSEGFRFYEAIRPSHWDEARPSRHEIETYVGLVNRWIRRDPDDRSPMHCTLDAHRLGLVDKQGRVMIDLVRSVRDFISEHAEETPAFDLLLSALGDPMTFESPTSQMPAPKGKAKQKLKKLKRKKGSVKRRR